MSTRDKLAVVFNEHTLGLLWIDEQGGLSVEPLRALTTKGAPFSVHDDPFIATPDKLRTATLTDFTDYRVQHSDTYLTADLVAKKVLALMDGDEDAQDQYATFVAQMISTYGINKAELEAALNTYI